MAKSFDKLMASHISIGKIGEDLACAYLVGKKYKVLARNHREKWDEIDIVARALDGTLVFVEVKTFGAESGAGLVPEDNMTPAKLKKLRRACEAFTGKRAELINEKKGWRIDLLAIVLGNSAESTIRHYENI